VYKNKVESGTHAKKRAFSALVLKCRGNIKSLIDSQKLKLNKMKKHLLLLSLVYISIAANGQNSIPNGNFETWNSNTYDFPQNYPYNSNPEAFFQNQLPFNVVKTTDAFHGSYAVKLTTVSTPNETMFGYFINTNPNNGDPSSWTGGVPFSQIPTGIKGHYKYNVATDDSATLFATFSKGGSNIGVYMFNIGGIHNTYAPFNFTFNPPLSVIPDSVVFGATSSNVFTGENGMAGSELFIDSVSFTGVSSQPALLNGDFESWESNTIFSPENWLSQYSQGDGVFRTSDAYGGNFAIELKTFLGNNNNGPAAQPGTISNGYNDNSCNCMMGGYPFANQMDTLVFYYKYTPADVNDSAQVVLNFKKNGASIGWSQTLLPASSGYQLMEIPFNIWQFPDTVIVQIQSTLWADTLLSSIGADLKIDDLHFKSQPINVDIPVLGSPGQISIFPNPSDGKFTVQNSGGIKQLKVRNLLGEIIYAHTNLKQEMFNEIDLSDFQKGIYFIELFDGKKINTKKIVIK
jgi:hypothetical protein